MIGKCIRIIGLCVVLLAVALPPLTPYIMRATYAPLDNEVGTVVPLSSAEMEQVFSGKNVLVVGATRGIGRGIAVALAGHGANVRVVGRSNGMVTMKKMKAVKKTDEQMFKAYSHDLTSVKGVKAFTKELIGDKYKMDYLVMTVGTWPHADDPLTADGIDKALALDLMARFVVLQDAATAGLLRPKAKVMNVLASGQKDASMTAPKLKEVIEFKDPGKHGMFDILMTAGPSGDVFMKQASLLYTDNYFIGTHPGLVPSDLTKDTFAPWLHNTLQALFSVLPLTTTEEECGEIHAQILASKNSQVKGVSFFSNFMEGRETYPVVQDMEFGNWYWNHWTEFVKKHQ